ncbi:MAG: PQQ-dependent sugar dehydrogenase, partial [Vicinamibacterales bacterium]
MTRHGKPNGDAGRRLTSTIRRYIAWTVLGAGGWLAISAGHSRAQAVVPTVLDKSLAVNAVVSGLEQPVGMAFIGERDILVLEKASGKVQRVTNGVVQTTPALDLAVNSASERGLLGIALHPDFPTNPGVYLYWTESTAKDDAGELVDTEEFASTPLLGNRVDRYVWNGSTLTLDQNLIRLRAIQADADQPERGNHNGGILRFERERRADDGNQGEDGDD